MRSRSHSSATTTVQGGRDRERANEEAEAVIYCPIKRHRPPSPVCIYSDYPNRPLTCYARNVPRALLNYSTSRKCNRRPIRDSLYCSSSLALRGLYKTFAAAHSMLHLYYSVVCMCVCMCNAGCASELLAGV